MLSGMSSVDFTSLLWWRVAQMTTVKTVRPVADQLVLATNKAHAIPNHSSFPTRNSMAYLPKLPMIDAAKANLATQPKAPREADSTSTARPERPLGLQLDSLHVLQHALTRSR